MTLRWPMGQFRKPQEFLENIFIFIIIIIFLNTLPTILGHFKWTFNKIQPGFSLSHDLELEGKKEGGRGAGLK